MSFEGTMKIMRGARFQTAASAVCALVCAVTLAAQTKVTAPSNKYTPADDVKLGREAAAQVRQQMPVMRDDNVNGYLEDIGKRLVQAIPPELQHPEFQYSFTGVDLKEINAFALPGGPMFINRGMMEKAHTEGEIAGVMAHELSHVALRHGTAQETKATPYKVGSIAGAILGAVVGGGWGTAISQGTQFGFGTAFLRFSREYEKEADILGTHIMSRAGYDAHDMANVFRTIEKEGGAGGPQWMSDHPNPGNRFEYINQEASALRVQNPITDTRAFQQIQAHLRTLPPAMSSEEAARRAKSGTLPNGGTTSRPAGRVAAPSGQYQTYTEGNLFRVQVPSNWREMPENNSVTFAPEGAFGTVNGQSVFTHGMQIGVARNETHDLETATTELLDALSQSNPRLTRPSGYSRASIGGQQALATEVGNVSDVTGGEERIAVYTTLLNDGTLFYALGVAPRNDYSSYQRVFSHIVQSIALSR